VPTLVIHGDDDQVVPIEATGKLAAEMIKGSAVQGVRRRAPRHLHHARRPGERRPAGVHQGLNGRVPATACEHGVKGILDATGAYGDLLGTLLRAAVRARARHAAGVHPGASPAAEASSLTPFAVTRITCLPGQLGMKQEIPCEDAFLVALHLVGMRHHETWVRGRPAVVRGYAPGALSIVDLRDDVASYLGTPLDALHFYVPHALVRAVAGAQGMAGVNGIACAPGLVDPVMCNLGAAVLALFERPQRAGALVQQHLALAICAHLVHRFGNNAQAGVETPRLARHLQRLH
jgi:hypothetical protein